ncbi:MAG: alpha/beta hydrolase [Bacteroidota bacterium]|nr:alpha/beta hydrolase [Bacteroidota bacterium]MDP3144220.1 alpha/beta hydrolase [Bacteroidota bacterium]
MSNLHQAKTIVFVHGLFVNAKSWCNWVKFFEAKGYKCFAPNYPFHEGEPSLLRNNINSNVGKLTFKKVVENFSDFIDTLPEKPILIGHSIGGLVVQKLIESNKAIAGICIDSAPPSGVISFERSFLRANLPTLNPFKGNSPCLPSVKWFQYAFCNTMTMEETEIEYNKYVVPESRNIPRNTTLGACFIDFKKPHNPLLIIAGEKDNIIPSSLNKKNFKAYKDKNSVTEFKEFLNRTHYICGQKNWEEVATFINDWLSRLK